MDQITNGRSDMLDTLLLQLLVQLASQCPKPSVRKLAVSLFESISLKTNVVTMVSAWSQMMDGCPYDNFRPEMLAIIKRCITHRAYLDSALVTALQDLLKSTIGR